MRHASAVSSNRAWMSVWLHRRGFASDVVRCCNANERASPCRTVKRARAVKSSVSNATGDDNASTAAPPRAVMPPSIICKIGDTSPYSGRGAVRKLQVDRPGDTDHAAQQGADRGRPELVAALVATDSERVGERQRTAGRGERRFEQHGVVQIPARRLERCALGGTDRPVPGRLVQETAEYRRTIETGEAQPVDRPTAAHQRSGTTIRQATRSRRWGSRSSVAGRLATVDVQNLAGDEGRRLQKEDPVDDVADLTDSTDRL